MSLVCRPLGSLGVGRQVGRHDVTAEREGGRGEEMDLLDRVAECVLKGDFQGIEPLLRQAVDAGMSPNRIISDGLVLGMEMVGKRFKAGDMFIPEVLASARAMHTGLAFLKPLLGQGCQPTACGTVILGTVKGDLHDIGKNLVAMMLEGVGFQIIDLGVDVATDRFLNAVREYKPDILAMSALLTTTMGAMREAIEALKREGLRDEVVVMVGGAPVNAEFASQIGADGYAPDAASAAELAKALVARRLGSCGVA